MKRKIFAAGIALVLLCSIVFVSYAAKKSTPLVIDPEGIPSIVYYGDYVTFTFTFSGGDESQALYHSCDLYALISDEWTLVKTWGIVNISEFGFRSSDILPPESKEMKIVLYDKDTGAVEWESDPIPVELIVSAFDVDSIRLKEGETVVINYSLAGEHVFVMNSTDRTIVSTNVTLGYDGKKTNVLFALTGIKEGRTEVSVYRNDPYHVLIKEFTVVVTSANPEPIPDPDPVPEPEVIKGLELDDDGVWRYKEDGEFVKLTGIVEYEGGQFFVAKGLLCSDVNGLAEYDGQWYFLSGGQIQTQYTGLALYDGAWFYIKDGLFDPNLNGLVDHDGSKFIVAAGQVVRGVNGLWHNTDGLWYYLADSQAVTYYTGLAEYDGAWFYVVNGILALDFSGTVEYDGKEFQVINGGVVIDP